MPPLQPATPAGAVFISYVPISNFHPTRMIPCLYLASYERGDAAYARDCPPTGSTVTGTAARGAFRAIAGRFAKARVHLGILGARGSVAAAWRMENLATSGGKRIGKSGP